MDVESVVDELYGLRPAEFTAARDRRALEARTAGDRELAERIRGLRRPTLAAWASNLLVRARPDEVRSLVALGEGLRRAHQNLDGAGLRELGRQQHVLVAALAEEAQRLAAAAGERVAGAAREQVEATLHAALADPESAGEWASGHLSKALSAPVGFGAAGLHTPEGSASPSRTREGGARGGLHLARGTGGHGDTAAGGRPAPGGGGVRGGTPVGGAAGAAGELRRAEREAAGAWRDVEARERDVRRVVEGLEKAEQRLREADAGVAELVARLKVAEERRDAARAAVRAARIRVEEAERGARRAREQAGNADERVRRVARRVR
ncbi:hypothetical protein [Streptomyces sp. TRM49041]|uniref:hypothetical protein n=1 Tax=Streptomyces sp. TRM49041 TaxID=2603216 RepID=UPI0011EC5667|nr:hypothetical protein [Streptomyces sp. TRM49041]